MVWVADGCGGFVVFGVFIACMLLDLLVGWWVWFRWLVVAFGLILVRWWGGL